MTEKNDYHVITEIKKGKNKIKNYEFLYKKYFGLIRKMSTLLFVKFKYSNSEIQKDYEQDAYFIMIEAIDDVDFSKNNIDINEWYFGGRFKLALQNLSKTYRKKIFRYKLIDIEECQLYNRLEYNYNFDEFNNFINHHSSNVEKVIVNYRLNGLTLKEIAKKMGKSFGWVHLHLYKLEKKFKENFGESV